MNSKIIFIIILLASLVAGCGVKGDPKKYPDTIVDSYVHDYTGSEPSVEELERIKSTKVIPSVVDPKQTPVPAPVKP